MATLSLRIPDSLHRKIKELASEDGYSMNQFLISAAAEKLASYDTVDYLKERSDRADRAALEKVLAKVPDTAPDEGDELLN